jgi:hypothetical protein
MIMTLAVVFGALAVAFALAASWHMVMAVPKVWCWLAHGAAHRVRRGIKLDWVECRRCGTSFVTLKG